MTEEEKDNLMNSILKLKKELLTLRFNKSSGDLKDVSKIRKIKKEIARLFTKLNAKA